MHRDKSTLSTTRLALALALLSFAASSGAQTASDVALRQAVRSLAMSVCEGCHETGGRSLDPAIPIIAAQPEPYLEVQLKAFRSQSRDDPKAHASMWDITFKYLTNDKIISGIAQYFSSQTPVAGTPGDPALMTKGKQLYEKGSFNPRIVPCSDCHGDNGQGIAIFPRLAGQHAEYLVRQMRMMRGAVRDSRVMHGVIGQLSDTEIAAVAAYLHSK